ncbi:MAG: nucleotidyltransferase family protein [Planctomycetota bacterium]
MISKQRAAFVPIKPILCDRYPGCSILLFGSVGRGEERPNSDLDIMVFHAGDGQIAWEPGASLGAPDLNVDLAVFPEDAFNRLVATMWYVFFEFSQAAIVHDPTGLAAKYQTMIREKFAEHPEVRGVWEEVLAAVARRKRGENVAIPHGDREGAERYIRHLLSGADQE